MAGPVIQVVTGGTDWPAIAGAIAAGVVGLAGITGTILAARLASRTASQNIAMTIVAENDRAHLAEKRRIYAKGLACFTEMASPLILVRAKPDVRRAAITQMSAVACEISLIANTDVSQLSHLWVSMFMLQHLSPKAKTLDEAYSKGDLNGSVLGYLTKAMRADLGEPEFEVPKAPEVTPEGQGGGGEGNSVPAAPGG